ncbi:MAG: HEAT repeat domain-containing protein [Verrucomicrobia bacterium]|nr:HEAT repeat domain-containing protein [Verrucomicrobiota bacterium]
MKTFVVLSRMRRALKAASLAAGLGAALCAGPALCAASKAQPPSKAQIAEAARAAASYTIGKSRRPFIILEEAARSARPGSELRKFLEDRLIDLVAGSAEPEARRLACRLLWAVGTDRSLPALEKLLDDPQTVETACFALRSFPSPKVNAILRRHLPKLRGPGRLAVINLLGDRRDPQAVPLLAASVESENAAEAEAALAALGRIGSPKAAEALLDFWAKSPPPPRRALAQALLQCGRRLRLDGRADQASRLFAAVWQGANSPRLRAAALLGMMRSEPERAPGLAAAALLSGEDLLARTAIGQIEAARDPRPARALLDQIHQLPPATEALLLDVLPAAPSPAAAAAAREFLLLPEAQPAAAAARLLGKLGEPADTVLLLRALAAKDARADAAAAALRTLDGERVNRILVRSLPRLAGPTRVRAIGILADRRAVEAGDALLRLAGKGAPEEAIAAFDALARLLPPERAGALVKAASATPPGQTRERAFRALGETLRRGPRNPRAAKALLAGYAAAADASLRAAFLELFPIVGDPAFLKRAVEAAHAADPETRAAAVRALAAWPSGEALEPLLALAQSGADPTTRTLALRGCLRLLGRGEAPDASRPAAAWAAVLRLCRGAAEKKQALAAMAAYPLPETLRAAAGMLNDPAVRAEARAAVKRMIAGLQSGAAGAAPIPKEKLDKMTDAQLKAAAEQLAKRLSSGPGKSAER